MKMIVEGMTCGHCVRAITSAIHRLDPSAQVDIDLGTADVSVAGSISVEAAVAAIQEAGYTVAAILDLGSKPVARDEAKAAGSCCGTCHSDAN